MQVRLFMEDLRNTGRLNGLTYTYWDENYTSKVGTEMPSASSDVAGKIFYANDWLLSVCGSPVRATGSKSSEIKNNQGQICCRWNTPGKPVPSAIYFYLFCLLHYLKGTMNTHSIIACILINLIC